MTGTLVDDRRRFIAISEIAKKDRDKIEALRLASEMSRAEVNLLAYGPTVVATKRLKGSGVPTKARWHSRPSSALMTSLASPETHKID